MWGCATVEAPVAVVQCRTLVEAGSLGTAMARQIAARAVIRSLIAAEQIDSMHACKRTYTHTMCILCGNIRESAAALSPVQGTRSPRQYAHVIREES